MKMTLSLLLAMIASLLCISSLANARLVARLIEDSQISDTPDGGSVCALAKGEEVTVIQWGQYAQVQFGQISGYVRSSSLSKATLKESFETPLRGKINADGVSMRLRPDTDSQIVAQLKNGADIEVIESANSYFLVKCGKSRGYVMQGYCDVPDYAGPSYPTLRMGCEGSQVLNLQRALIERGFLSGDPSPTYGSTTREAVKSFEEANGLNADGIADSTVQTLLFG